MTQLLDMQIRQKIDLVNAKYLILPVWMSGEPEIAWGNFELPNPHARSSVGDTGQRYPVGAKYVDGDRTFHYGYVADVANANKANIGMFNKNEADGITWGATAGVAGDTLVGIIASGLADTTPARDDFAGGWLLPRTNPYSSYRIIKSSVSGDRVSGEVDLTLDYGLIEAVSASQGSCFVNKSEYTKLSQQWAAGLDYATCPGVTLIDPIASTWQWVQSWGPCYVVPYNEEIGAAANVHGCVFHVDGTIRVETRNTTTFRQLAGYLLNSASTSFTSSWLIRLQVNP